MVVALYNVVVASRRAVLFFLCADNGMLLLCAAVAGRPHPFNYTDYVLWQRAKTDRVTRTGQQWVLEETVAAIADYVRGALPCNRSFALAHGVRSGRETVWLRARLPGVQVWGTELSPVAAATAPWTVAWDFHAARPEWRGAADFVYSNALDHAFNATLALETWLGQLAPGGAVLMHWAGSARPSTGLHKHTDIFYASHDGLMRTLCAVGAVVRVLALPRPRFNWIGDKARKQTVYVLRPRAVAPTSLCAARRGA